MTELSETCQKKCDHTCKAHCCLNCAYKDTSDVEPDGRIAFWCRHDFQLSVLHPDPTRPMSAGKHRHKIDGKSIPDKPCAFWSSCFAVNTLGEIVRIERR